MQAAQDGEREPAGRKKPYRRPELVEYGRMVALTQGPGGNIPDVRGDTTVGSCQQQFSGQINCGVG